MRIFNGSWSGIVKQVVHSFTLYHKFHDLAVARESGSSGEGEPYLFCSHFLGNDKGQFTGTALRRTEIIHHLRPDPVGVVLPPSELISSKSLFEIRTSPEVPLFSYKHRQEKTCWNYRCSPHHVQKRWLSENHCSPPDG